MHGNITKEPKFADGLLWSNQRHADLSIWSSKGKGGTIKPHRPFPNHIITEIWRILSLEFEMVQLGQLRVTLITPSCSSAARSAELRAEPSQWSWGRWQVCWSTGCTCSAATPAHVIHCNCSPRYRPAAVPFAAVHWTYAWAIPRPYYRDWLAGNI